jgi:hypothetical protein
MQAWGSQIDTIYESYAQLLDEEKSKLRVEISSRIRFGLLHQYVGHFGREIKSSSDDVFLCMIRTAFVLVDLDNFEYDYRETTLRFEGLIKLANVRKQLFKSALVELNKFLPERAKNILKRMQI